MSESNVPVAESVSDARKRRRRRQLKAAWVLAGVLAVAGTAFSLILAPYFAERDCERALREWKAAGLHDPLAPYIRRPVPDSLNLLKVPPFDIMARTYSGPDLTAWRIGFPLIYREQGYDSWEFDPKLSFQSLVVVPPVDGSTKSSGEGESPAQVLIRMLEEKFPDLTRVEATLRLRPEIGLPPFDWTSPESRWTGLSTDEGNLLTLYAGCKILEGKGDPAFSVIKILIRCTDGMIDRRSEWESIQAMAIARACVPRLVRLGLERGVWTDSQILSLKNDLAELRVSSRLHTAIQTWVAPDFRLCTGLARGDSDCLLIRARLASRRYDPVGPRLEWWGLPRSSTALWRGAAGRLDDARNELACYIPGEGWDISALVRDADAKVLSGRIDYERIFDLERILEAMLADAGLTLAETGCALE